MDVRRGNQFSNSFQFIAQNFKMILLGIIIILCIFTINQFKISLYFPIKTVRVYGLSHINHQEVQTILLPLVKNSFFSVDVERIRDTLLQLAWVSDTFVRRSWPDEIEITVLEKTPIARWNGDILLSQSGELFKPKQANDINYLPDFNGPDGQHVFMLDYFTKINRLLTPLHAKISYLELTPYQTWQLKLDNGIILKVGHKDILTRLDHFVKVYSKIVGERSRDVDYIDLRYPNGMAIRWKNTMRA